MKNPHHQQANHRALIKLGMLLVLLTGLSLTGFSQNKINLKRIQEQTQDQGRCSFMTHWFTNSRPIRVT